MVLFVSTLAKSSISATAKGNPLKRHFLFQQHKLVVIVPTIGLLMLHLLSNCLS
jgi:hypothetical protein